MPASALSQLARLVLRALATGPGTAETLGLTTRLPAGVVDSILAELRNAGLVDEVEPHRFALRRPT